METVLEKADYVEHQTIYEGEKVYGWVRYALLNGRFHALVNKNIVTIHIDYSARNGKHYVPDNWNHTLFLEVKRIKKIYRELNPAKPPPESKPKKESKNIFAPNLMELQKNFKQPEKTLVEKIKSHIPFLGP